jgi:hypothetical protein
MDVKCAYNARKMCVHWGSRRLEASLERILLLQPLVSGAMKGFLKKSLSQQSLNHVTSASCKSNKAAPVDNDTLVVFDDASSGYECFETEVWVLWE